ncbi:hypothetical protein AQF52_5385 [Streptomyces venezuelae]|uniref:hypothetical protein n=1 Tax=Streptomyces gardneri TaxID=66892 RepID=UPI000720E5E8|nr:hypothetical protein [Streptomyces gardneri]ALO10979.1 hypothetical protein AQF52_5385 [Streptomyces venezuelae]WRK39381.1 hypothetical protein U0M97_27150 [Streptomyces venezuelae]
MTAPPPPPSPLTLEAARRLQGMLRAEIGPGLTEQELDAIETRFGFTFSADHRVFLAAGLPHGSSRWPDWRNGDPEDLAERLAWPVEGVLFDVKNNVFWHPAWPPRPAETSEALRVARTELESVPQLVPVYAHRYLPGTTGEHGHPVLSVYQTDIILYGNDLPDYIHHEFTGRPSSLLARTTVDFWSYFVEGGPGIDVSLPTPFTPYARSTQEAVDCIRMLALERLIDRRHHPEQLIEAGLTALVLDVETDTLPLLAGLSRSEHEQADALFDQVLDELGLSQNLPADTTDLPWEAARWELVRWWLRLIVNGSLAPGAGGDLITYEGWAALARPQALKPLVDRTDTYNDWAAVPPDDREPRAKAIVEEAERLLAAPWPPPSD